jgi:hypothetical protein
MSPNHRLVAEIGFFFGSNQRRVPHISLVFREMWDTTNFDLLAGWLPKLEGYRSGTHISRKTSEIWATRNPLGWKNVQANAG